MKMYEKPVISVDAGMTEGVYAAGGAGEITASEITVTADWGGSGQMKFSLDLSALNRSQLTVVLTFNMDINNCWGGGASVTPSSGKTVTLSWYDAPEFPEIYVQVDRADFKNLKITGSSYSNN